MRNHPVALGAAIGCAAAAILATSAPAATRCVGSGKTCAHTIQAALDAAHDGDVIKVGPGRFAGGITIAKRVTLSGAGAGETVIRGGGPVVTVDPAATAATIAGVTITGGHTTTSSGQAFVAFGGGVFVPGGDDDAPGATVTIRDSVVSGNRASPAAVLHRDPGDTDAPACPDGPCSFGGANGAGIWSEGSVTLVDSAVRGNRAGGPNTSDAIGAGVWSARGTLKVVRSAVARNRAVVTPPHGRFAEGGGIYVDSGAFVLRDSLVAGNATRLTSTFPGSVDMTTQAAGVFVTDGIATTIDGSTITGNEVSAHDPGGEPAAYDSGLLVLDSTPVVRDTVISANRVTSLTGTTADIGPAGGAAEFHLGGTLRDVRIVGNTSNVRTTAGDATVAGALIVFDFSGDPVPLRLRDTLVAGNAIAAAGGASTAQGAGIYNNSLLDLRGTRVLFNAGRAATAQGGGIWNGVAVSGPPVELTAVDSVIAHNALYGGERHGGGLFTTEPVTLRRTPIVHNAPDQCSGCD